MPHVGAYPAEELVRRDGLLPTDHSAAEVVASDGCHGPTLTPQPGVVQYRHHLLDDLVLALRYAV